MANFKIDDVMWNPAWDVSAAYNSCPGCEDLADRYAYKLCCNGKVVDSYRSVNAAELALQARKSHATIPATWSVSPEYGVGMYGVVDEPASETYAQTLALYNKLK